MTARKKKAVAKRATPAVGDTITKVYKGEKHAVRVTEDGFKYGRKTYRSLTAIAKQITGYKAVSGPRWFGLTDGGVK